MSHQDRKPGGGELGGNVRLPILANERDRHGRRHRLRRVAAQPAAAFLAQLFGAQARKKRLEMAREDARSIHDAYRDQGQADRRGREVDILI